MQRAGAPNSDSARWTRFSTSSKRLSPERSLRCCFANRTENSIISESDHFYQTLAIHIRNDRSSARSDRPNLAPVFPADRVELSVATGEKQFHHAVAVHVGGHDVTRHWCFAAPLVRAVSGIQAKKRSIQNRHGDLELAIAIEIADRAEAVRAFVVVV